MTARDTAQIQAPMWCPTHKQPIVHSVTPKEDGVDSPAVRYACGDWLDGTDPTPDGTSGQDRESYTDDQDRDSYEVSDGT